MKKTKLKGPRLTPKEPTSTLYIRNVPTSVKKKFTDQAKRLGYKPREFFEAMVSLTESRIVAVAKKKAKVW
jgi:CRP-like cAMP-binding protein